MYDPSQVEELFFAALEKGTPEERSAFLDVACPDEPEVRQRVELLLAAHPKAKGFLEPLAASAGATADSSPAKPGENLHTVDSTREHVQVPTEMIGSRIGPYKLLQRLGEGGMGTVYLAEQEHPVKRRVALKIIKTGMDSVQVVARFEQERQALAVMDHPNIAKVLDAGATEAGRPFFVMELVKGIPITRFCDQEHLTPRERLELFVPVCQAVQHAHQKGIIHRDLKPSNILIALYDGKAVPKVIDFGVAKATHQKLTERTMFTEVGSIVGTLEYMAPEQAELNNLDIDTRADIYSLGVLLYELLAGSPPFTAKQLRGAAFTEMLRMIREVEPPKPSTRLSSSDELPSIAANRKLEPRRLTSLVTGELDWIVMKALEKDRGRRYETANSLAMDIQRYLSDEPVEARPNSPTYRLQKFYHRNRGAVIAAGLVLLALIGGMIGTTWGFIRAEKQRQVAQSNAKAAARARNEAEERAKSEERAKTLAQVETKRAEHEKTRADKKAEEVWQALYATRQQVAMNAWRENRTDLMTEVLGRQKPAAGEPDLRGFEWAYLDRLAQAPGRRWQFTGPMVNGATISPDNKLAITVGFDGKATAWDVVTGRKVWDTGAAFRWSVNAAAFAPDGKTVALAGHLGQLELWDPDGTQRAKLSGHRAQVFGVAFSPDSKMLSSASADISVRLWDVVTAADAGVLSVGPQAEGGGRGPHVIPATDPGESIGHTNMVWQTTWAPDGKRLASCSTDGTIKIWAMPDRRLLRTMFGHEGVVVAVAWSPDGRLIAGVSRQLADASTGEIKLWNPDTGRAEATFRPPTGGLHAVAFTPDGFYVVTGGQDRTVRVWRKDGRLVAEHRGFRDEVVGLAVGGGGRWAVTGTRAGEIIAIELESAPGRSSGTASGNERLAMTKDGRLAAFRHGEVHWLHPETLAETASWPAAKVPSPSSDQMLISNAAAFAMRSDGEMAHSGNSYVGPGTVVWRDASGSVRHLLSGHDAPLSAIVFLPDDQLASADENGAIRIWNGVTGKAISEIQAWDGPIHFLVDAENGCLWAGGAHWQPGSKPSPNNRPTSTEGRLARIENGRIAWEGETPATVTAADASPDKRLLVVASADGALAWIDARTGNEIRRRASSAAGAMVALRYSPSERRIAVGSADGKVRLLDADSGEELLVLEGLTPAPVASLVFFPDGKRLAATAGQITGGTMIVWDGRPASDPPLLPSPDIAWHKARLAVAANSGKAPFGPRVNDVFAMSYHLNRLAALEPNDIQWPRSLLALDQDAGDYHAAATRLVSIVDHWPADATMWYDLGNARRELEDTAGAEAAFRKCLFLDPQMAQAHCNLGLLLGRDGRLPEAIEALERGHELGTAQQKAGKGWIYPTAQWLARHKRLADVSARYGTSQDLSDVPDTDRADLVEVLLLLKRPLAAIRLADPKPEQSPGPVVVGAALHCAEGIGDAEPLAAADRSEWRAKALVWLRLDFDGFQSGDATTLARQSAGMREHPFLKIAQGDRVASWSPAEREGWHKFWAEVNAAAGVPGRHYSP